MNAPSPPDVLLVIVDDLRFDRLGCTGLSRAETPVLDRLAADGVLFTNAHAVTGWTLPSCATIVTGRVPSDHGLIHHDHRFGAPKIPTLLGDGWATYGIGNNGNLVPDTVSSDALDALGLERRPEVWKHFGWQDGFERYDWFPKQDKDGPFAAIIAWLENRVADTGPRFAMFHTNLVHDYDDDAPWCLDVERFLGRPLPNPLHKFRDGPWLWKDPPEGLSLADVDEGLLAKYDGGIAEFDRRLGAVLSHVDLRRTVVCVVSDHGEGFDGEHLRVHHCGRLHEDLLHIPVILRLPPGTPGAPAPGTRNHRPASLIDIAPTLLALAGSPDASLPGENLLDLPAERGLPGEDFGYLYLPPNDVSERLRRYEYKTYEVSLRSTLSGTRKTIEGRIGRQEWTEEYDLATDPLERINRARGAHGPTRKPQRAEGGLRAAVRDRSANSDEAQLCALPGSYPRVARRISSTRKLPPLERHRSYSELTDAEPITFIVAVDNPVELRRHVLSSACYAHDAHQWLFVENGGNRAYSSISRLYRDAVREARNDLVFYVHQDVLFPPDFEDRLHRALADLESRDARWGVIGAAGRAPFDAGAPDTEPANIGHWSDPHKYHKPRVPLPAEVQVLDELWLGVRRSSGLEFDADLPGFHCYGADLCMTARAAGRKSYVLDTPVIHKLFRPDGSLIERSEQSHKIEGRQTKAFRADFLQSADHVRTKWTRYLPIQSTCHLYE